MNDQKIYYPQTIEENPFPTTEGEQDFEITQQTKGEYSNQTTKPKQFPTKRIAYEVLGSALNTRSRRILAQFEFTQSGALQIGKYENGVNGDVRISQNGIVGRDSAGLTTFALDATTGNVVFKGEVQAGSLISGLVVVGDNSVVIDGENRRMVFYDENDIPSIVIGYLE